MLGLSSRDYQGLEHRLSRWGTQAQLLHDMWNLPRSGIKPLSSALAGGLFTTEPPGNRAMTPATAVPFLSLIPSRTSLPESSSPGSPGPPYPRGMGQCSRGHVPEAFLAPRQAAASP